MLRMTSGCGLVSLTLVAWVIADEPRPPDKKVAAISRDLLLGKWCGPGPDPVTLEFRKDKVVVTVPARISGRPEPSTLEWDYDLDPRRNQARLGPLPFSDDAFLGLAKLRPDGSLSVLIVKVPPAIPKDLEDVTFTRLKAPESKK